MSWKLGDLGKKSVTCVDTLLQGLGLRPRPLHLSMSCLALSNCLSEAAPARGHQGPELRAGDCKREKLKFRRGW